MMYDPPIWTPPETSAIPSAIDSEGALPTPSYPMKTA
jgi:hypothetical protein